MFAFHLHNSSGMCLHLALTNMSKLNAANEEACWHTHSARTNLLDTCLPVSNKGEHVISDFDWFYVGIPLEINFALILFLERKVICF